MLGLHFPAAFTPRTGPLLGERGFFQKGDSIGPGKRAGEKQVANSVKMPKYCERLQLGKCRDGRRERWLCLPSSDMASPTSFKICFQLDPSTFCDILEGVGLLVRKSPHP